jgi:uncharacterized protein (TIGR03032 family)
VPPNSRSDASFGKPGAATDSVAPPDELAADTCADPGFLRVLAQAGVSLVVTVQPGHVGCFGCADGRLTATFTRCAAPFGIACKDGRLVIAMPREIIAFALSTRLAPFYPPRPDHYDGIFIPVGSFRTGACNTHDIELDGPSVVFANTRFSCLSRSDATSSFIPLWQPPFISALMPDDRCHLNSFALGDGRIRYATAFASSDTRQGYRDLPLDAGVIIDVEANAIAAVGLLKPHSVRLFDNQLYVCNSAAGEVVRVDLAARSSTVLAELPGFTRGLRALGDVLLVGLSTLRVTARELDLPFARRQESLTAAIVALDRRSGAELGRLSLPPSITEVLDFVAVPGVYRACVQDPAAIGPDIGIETPAGSYWMKTAAAPEPE